MPNAKRTKHCSLPLLPEQIDALNRIAAETGSVALRGPKAGEPSWRALLYRIADGELIVIEQTQTRGDDK